MSGSTVSSVADGSEVSNASSRTSRDETRRVLVITGAGQANGIGQAVARDAVLHHDYAVLLGTHSGSSPAQLDGFVAELNASSGSYHTVAAWAKCDVTDWGSLQAFLARAAELFGGVDVVFCNAGVAAPYKKASLAQKTAPQYPTLDVNVSGALYTMEAAMAFFEANPRPNQVILPTISMAGFNPIPANPIYAASKAALVGATISFARRLELSKKPTRLNAIAPYYLRTNLCPQAFIDKIGAQNLVPMEPVVETVLDLIAPDSRKHGVIVKIQPGPDGPLVEDYVPAPVDFYGIPQ